MDGDAAAAAAAAVSSQNKIQQMDARDESRRTEKLSICCVRPNLITGDWWRKSSVHEKTVGSYWGVAKVELLL